MLILESVGNKTVKKKKKIQVIPPSRQVWCYYLDNSFQRAFEGGHLVLHVAFLTA